MKKGRYVLTLPGSGTRWSLPVVLCLVCCSAFAAPGGVDEGLRVWLRAGAGVSAPDGGPVLVWTDLSGHGNDARFDPANVYGEQPPNFDASNPGADDKATVRFSSQNALEIDLSWLADSDYTIFVVNARDRFGLANFYIAGDSAVQDRNLTLGYEQVGLLRQAHFNRDLDAFVTPYQGAPLWALDTFRFSRFEGKTIFQDGTMVAADGVVFPLISNTGTTLGHFRAFGPLFWFQGDLAEVLIYDRAVNADERLRIEAELAGRYGRALTLEDYVPCDGSWDNKGRYVSSLAHAVEVFVAAGLLTEAEGEAAVSGGARSSCSG